MCTIFKIRQHIAKTYMSAHKRKDGQMYKLTVKQISIAPMNKETMYFQVS